MTRWWWRAADNGNPAAVEMCEALAADVGRGVGALPYDEDTFDTAYCTAFSIPQPSF